MANFRRPYDQFDKFNKSVIEEVMKCAVNVAEDIQEEGERYGKHVDKIEQYLLEFAKLSEDVAFRKEAMDKVQEVAGSEVQEDTEPPELFKVFQTCLKDLEESKKASYDPRTHPIVEDFMERVRNIEDDSEQEVLGQNDADGTDLVMGQVDISLKCPITKVFYEDPVTSRTCKHSYSREAILAHISQSRRPIAKCPVCGVAISVNDLVKDKKLEKMVRKAKKQKTSSHTGVIKL